METGDWRVESGDWRLETGEWSVWRVKSGEYGCTHVQMDDDCDKRVGITAATENSVEENENWDSFMVFFIHSG